MRMRSLVMTAAALLLAVPATAVGQVAFGPQLSFGGDTDLGIGGRVVANVESLEHWDFVGTFDVWFPDDGGGVDVSAWEANGNLAYNFVVEDSELNPYAGAGLSIFHVSFDSDGPGDGFDDTDLGLNFFGGLKFPGESVTPFVEVRAVLEGADQVAVTGGILF
ncbi:MAG: hypothetical protein ACODAB_06810 [Gemmatimonadota bacterium]